VKQSVVKKKVLIVDDEPSVGELLRDVFGRFEHGHEYQISTARDGADALMLLLREEFDLVLLDMHMPRLSGLALLKEMRGLRIMVPVLMLTGNQDAKAAAEAISAGVLAYVPKPFDMPQLEHLVALAFSRRRRATGGAPAKG
jgi:DNA-binding NtrC family response regulator